MVEKRIHIIGNGTIEFLGETYHKVADHTKYESADKLELHVDGELAGYCVREGAEEIEDVEVKEEIKEEVEEEVKEEVEPTQTK